MRWYFLIKFFNAKFVPTILIVDGFRFFFYRNENDEPPHIHVVKANANGKVWLLPTIEVAYMYGFTNAEQKKILEAVHLNYLTFIQKWNDYFG